MKARITSLLSIIFFSTYIQAIPLSPDSSTVTLSQTNLTGNNGGFCAPASEYSQWVRSGWLREDCYAAFNMMRSSVLGVKDVEYSFVDIRSKSFPTKPNEVMTPKRYTVGKFAPKFPGRAAYPSLDRIGKTYERARRRLDRKR